MTYQTKPPETLWRLNTLDDPFFKSKVPVEVGFKDGKQLRISCPGCNRKLMEQVSMWRPVYQIPGSND